MLANPTLQFFPIDRRQLRQVGSQPIRLADVDMLDLALFFFGVPMEQHANAERQRAGNRDFVTAHQRDVEPTKLPGRQRREFRV
jgi:hypothetical protein